jgi:pyrimidine-nucleoside phosphorylase
VAVRGVGVLGLAAGGPDDLLEVTYALGAEMLVLGGTVNTHAEARRAMERAISSGAAAERFAAIIEAQGGNPGVVEDPAVLPQANACELFAAPRRGFVARIEPRGIGRGLTALGGGRTKVDDIVEPSVGFVITARVGDWVEAGEPLATIFASDTSGIEVGRAALRSAITIGDEAELPLPLISHRVTVAGVRPYTRDEPDSAEGSNPVAGDR